MSAEPTTPKLRGGIDLGGTKVQAVIIAAEDTGRRPGAPPDADHRRRRRRRRRAGDRGSARRRRRPASRPSDAAGVGVGSPGTIDDATPAPSATPRNLPGMMRAAPGRAGALQAPRGRRCTSATTSRSRRWPSSSSAPASPYQSLLGVFWGTGVGGGLILDGKPWHGRGGAGEIGHMVVQVATARCARAAATAAWRPTPGARRSRPGARGARRRGPQDRSCSRS